LGPGDLYTSVLAGLIVEGVARALRATRAKRLYVCNLMTKPGETERYEVFDHVEAVLSALGADALDYVLASCTDLDAAAKEAYARHGQLPVALSSPERMKALTRAEILARDVGDQAQLVRHDTVRLRAEIFDLLRRERSSSFLRR
ncbi:MAG TPA: 2-phospho-L-lactate transferase CofD family protein, partial [Polyangiaceae bacterium]